jgi:hypothetical protein
MVKYNATKPSTTPLEVEEEALPAAAPNPVGDTGRTVAGWLRKTKLEMCEAALAEAGYDAELEMVVDGDVEEVADMISAVEAVEGIKKKTTVKKFKRELAKVRGKGEMIESREKGGALKLKSDDSWVALITFRGLGVVLLHSAARALSVATAAGCAASAQSI